MLQHNKKGVIIYVITVMWILEDKAVILSNKSLNTFVLLYFRKDTKASKITVEVFVFSIDIFKHFLHSCIS